MSAGLGHSEPLAIIPAAAVMDGVTSEVACTIPGRAPASAPLLRDSGLEAATDAVGEMGRDATSIGPTMLLGAVLFSDAALTRDGGAREAATLRGAAASTGGLGAGLTNASCTSAADGEGAARALSAGKQASARCRSHVPGRTGSAGSSSTRRREGTGRVGAAAPAG